MKNPLTHEKFQAIAVALGRLQDIKEMSALATTKAIEAEALGLVEFLSTELLEYAGELMGCWYAVRTEYEPLVNCLRPVIARGNAINQQVFAQQQAKQAQPEAAPVNPANVIKL